MEIMRISYENGEEIEQYRMTKEEKETIEKFLYKLELNDALEDAGIRISFSSTAEVLDF